MPNVFLSLSGFFSSLSPVTQFFIVVIVILFLGFNYRYSPRVVSVGPTILTTIGIFATFLGIAIGLYGFDSTNIQSSVPSLLEGLKTAFWASVFGVGAAVLMKLRELVPAGGSSGQEGGADEATGADIVKALTDVRNALASETEGSLVSQVKLARQDSNDRLDKLREAQTQALQKLSEMGSKALVEALRDVIRDFNQRITEQFGENFKELNAAVGRLLRWQDNYMKTLDALGRGLETTISLLGAATDDIKTVVSSSEKFADTANRLSATLSVLDASEARLNDVARGLLGLLESATGRIPEVEQRLTQITTQMAAAVQKNQSDLNAALLESSTSIARMQESSRNSMMEMAKSTSEALKDNQKSIGVAINDNMGQLSQLASQMTAAVQRNQSEINKAIAESIASVKRIHESSEKGIADIARTASDALRENQKSIAIALNDNAVAMKTGLQASQQEIAKSSGEFDRQIKDLMQKTKEQVSELDRALATELTKALESLARQFTSISDQFAKDYTPLARELRRVVEIASGVTA